MKFLPGNYSYAHRAPIKHRMHLQYCTIILDSELEISEKCCFLNTGIQLGNNTLPKSCPFPALTPSLPQMSNIRRDLGRKRAKLLRVFVFFTFQSLNHLRGDINYKDKSP